MLTKERKGEIQQQAINAINSMRSVFFIAAINLPTMEEAEYAADLWSSRRDGLRVTYFAMEPKHDS